MDAFRVSLIQADIIWEDKIANMKKYESLLKNLSGKTDLVILPEMFSTGFSMFSKHLAEKNSGETVEMLQKWAKQYGFAISGSFLAINEEDQMFNRGFFITPDDKTYFYDKRHLFRMGDENEQFIAGDKQLIISYNGWNIKLIICYDLRFPVWIRNVNNAYDLLICVANWPQARETVWDTLLKARALENLCYVCGVNRIGNDGHQVKHNGHSMIIDPLGEIIAQCENEQERVITHVIDKDFLDKFRQKFPVWKDADHFEIKLG